MDARHKTRHFEIAGDPDHVFVRDPASRGRYLRVRRGVIERACPRCKSVVGEPCKTGSSGPQRTGRLRYNASTCYQRRKQSPSTCDDCAGKPVPFGRFCGVCRERRLRESARRTAAHWRRADPERERFRSAFARAVRRGDLVRPESCSRCHEKRDPIHGHHPDYTKPLEVIWLCETCHFDEHRQIGRRPRRKRTQEAA